MAQVIAVLLPVGASRLSLALYPGLLGEALELFLAAFLVDARSGRAAFAALLVAQLAYVGSIVNVSAFVGLFVLLEIWRGERATALRLLLFWGAAAAFVFVLLDLRFLPTLLDHVLPHLGETSGKTATAPLGFFALAGGRVNGFFDLVVPCLALVGIAPLLKAQGAPRHMGIALLLGGAALVALRALAPALFEDVKDVELLLPILSVLASAGLFILGKGGRAGLAVRIVGLLAIAYFGLPASASSYSDRFFAVGR